MRYLQSPVQFVITPRHLVAFTLVKSAKVEPESYWLIRLMANIYRAGWYNGRKEVHQQKEEAFHPKPYDMSL